MKIAVLSGKGGAGKTFVAAGLACAAGRAAYVDCDVEEPNGRLFFRPENVARRVVERKMPEFDREKCVVTGELKLGEATGVPVISAALEAAGDDGLTVIDCPPGSSCAVMESARGADYCVLVTEPTAFGLHDLRLVAELMRVLKKPCGVVVNKAGADYPELERWLEAEGLPVLARIPYSGALACREDEGARSLFSGLLTRIRGEAAE